ncbi:ABC transporter ATP-binding protein [Vulcanisaeta souniana]|uniref:ABC transporter n=1 Tax=Vulcanisaeta souniana JCM 11219 TaxID=1293586 RepID=A0A830E297_9CREN|nr:ABC transporter ATP-binding protein [Vulcanisaeta souniana]GGI79494.1 ABC transporter [Vulcanisaeta souniana JCM 11219]
MSNYVVRFVNARIGYDEPVIKDITLSIPRPSLTTILGPNGSGKTTLLRAIIKYAKVFGGYAYIDGREISELSIGDLPKYVSYSPAEIYSQMALTVLDVVMSSRNSGGWVSRDEAIATLRYLGVGNIVGKRFDELSTGQKRLTLIARALSSKAPLLLLDEPTSNLDLGNKYRVILILRRVVSDRGITVIATGHDIDLALASDWVVAIRDGEVMAMGAPGDIINSKVLSELYGIDVEVLEVNGYRLIHVRNDR